MHSKDVFHHAIALVLLLCVSAASNARPLSVVFADPVGDQAGRIDIVRMVIEFESKTGDYEIELRAEPANPFDGQFRVNVNTYNPDARVRAENRSYFGVTVRDFNLASSTTSIRLTGTHPSLVEWEVGDRVATSTPPFGNPPGSSFFRSSVLDMPFQPGCALNTTTGIACNEDPIGYGATATVVRGPAANTMDGDVSVVSAANFRPVVSPDSLASVFGQSLSSATVQATLDSRGQLPLELGGTRLFVDGRPAPLVFVSPGQINCWIPPETSVGTVEVVVNTGSGSSLRGTAEVLHVAPALFSLDASGRGPAAALNAVTFRGGPFRVETLSNSGEDKRTRLSFFGTGFRRAGSPQDVTPTAAEAGSSSWLRKAALQAIQTNLQSRLGVGLSGSGERKGGAFRLLARKDSGSGDTHSTNVAGHVRVEASDAGGMRWPLPVEFAGPAPGFFGLDQANVVLPASADGAGELEVKLIGESIESNAVTILVDPVNPSNPCAFTGPCPNLTGRWKISESLTQACTFTALGQTESDRENYSGSGTVDFRDEGNCRFSFAPVVVPGSGGVVVGDLNLRRTWFLNGNQFTFSGPAVELVPGAPLTLTKNEFKGQGTVCGAEINVTGSGGFAFTAVGEGGVMVSVSCTLNSTGRLTRVSGP